MRRGPACAPGVVAQEAAGKSDVPRGSIGSPEGLVRFFFLALFVQYDAQQGVDSHGVETVPGLDPPQFLLGVGIATHFQIQVGKMIERVRVIRMLDAQQCGLELQDLFVASLGQLVFARFLVGRDR